MSDSASPTAKQPTPALKPRDAATLIIVDTSSGAPRLLMGRRRMDMVFMPGKFVFPGGRVDDADKGIVSADELNDGEVHKLLSDMKGRPSAARARALALAAVRETFEETGLIVGEQSSEPVETQHAGWQAFIERKYLPTIAQLTFFARAITPPGRPRRFDTRFFCVSAEAISEDTGAVDDELSDIDWYSVEDTTELDLPPITRVIIQDLADRLKIGPLGTERPLQDPTAGRPDVMAEATLDQAQTPGKPLPWPVPYYHHKHGKFRRDIIESAR